MIRLSLLLLAVLFLAACETVIDVEPPEHERQLVVNGPFRVGSQLAIDVTHSVGLLDNDNPGVVTNATGVLWADGHPLDTLQYRPYDPDDPYEADQSAGRYRSDVVVQAGQTYTLRVTAPGFDAVEAESTVPPHPEVTADVRTRTAPAAPYYPPDYQPTLADVDVHLSDPPGERNYYALHVYQEVRYEDYEGTERVSYRFVEYELSDPLLEDDLFGGDIIDDEGTSHWGRLYFSDRHIDGRRHTLHLTTRIVDAPGDNAVATYVVLEALSPDLYEYRRTRALFDDTDDNPFAEPVDVHSNMSNGLGIFAGASMVEVRLE